MLIRESQLRAIIREELLKEHQELLNEFNLKNLGINLGLMLSLAGLVPEIGNAASPDQVVKKIDGAMQNAGKRGSFVQRGDKLGIELPDGRFLKLMSANDTDNISNEELNDIVIAIEDNAEGREIKSLIDKAITSIESESRGEKDEILIDNIIKLDDDEIEEIIDEFEKSQSESGYNLHIMAYRISARKIIEQKKPLARSLNNNKKRIIVYLIMKHFSEYTEYLPSR